MQYACAQDTVFHMAFYDTTNNIILPRAAIKSNDNSFYSVSVVNLCTPFCGSILITKFDSLYQYDWQRKYFVPSLTLTPSDMIEINPNRFLILGNGSNFNQDSSYQAYLTIDENGNLIDTCKYWLNHSAETVLELNGEFYTTGYFERNNIPGPPYDLFVSKIDSLFNPVWTYEYSIPTGTYFYQVKAITPLSYNGLIMATTYTDTIPNSPSYGIIMKLDTAGTILWSYKYDQGPLTSFSDIKPLPDGGFIVAGSGNLPNQYTGFLFKIDSMGNVVWSKVYSMNGFCYALNFTSDGGFIVGGLANNTGSDAAYLMKTDSLGNPQWVNFNQRSNSPIGLTQTADGGYLYTALGYYSQSFTKTDSAGNSGCYNVPFTATTQSIMNRSAVSFSRTPFQLTKSPAAILVDTVPMQDTVLCAGYAGLYSISPKLQTLSLIPNPAHSQCRISAPAFNNALLTLYDLTGRIVLSEKFFSSEQTINISALLQGIYFIKIFDAQSGKVAIGKLVKE